MTLITMTQTLSSLYAGGIPYKDSQGRIFLGTWVVSWFMVEIVDKGTSPAGSLLMFVCLISQQTWKAFWFI